MFQLYFKGKIAGVTGVSQRSLDFDGRGDPANQDAVLLIGGINLPECIFGLKFYNFHTVFPQIVFYCPEVRPAV